jgi:hypothetical protein
MLIFNSKRSLVLLFAMLQFEIDAQLTLDKREIIIGLTSGIHYQKGLEAPYGNSRGVDLLEFKEKPGAFYRFGLSAEYVVRGFEQRYTKNRTSMHTMRLGWDHSITKAYETKWFEVSQLQQIVPLNAKCKFWHLNMAYIVRKPKGMFTFGYGLNVTYYRFHCYPTPINPETFIDGAFYHTSHYGLAPMLLFGIALKQWTIELNGEAQWLWNHNVLGHKHVENEPPFFERLKTYSNVYALARLSVGYRINLNR